MYSSAQRFVGVVMIVKRFELCKVWQPIKKMRNFFCSKHLSDSHKVKLYTTYVETALLYNSETWTLTKTIEDSLNSFHRRLLRIALNVKYPKKISNAKLYKITKEIPISEKIKKRRLSLFGHILRLDPDTPAQRALQYFITPAQRPVGGQHSTWLGLVTRDLKHTLTHHNIKTPLNQKSLQSLSTLARDNAMWRKEIVRSMEREL